MNDKFGKEIKEGDWLLEAYDQDMLECFKIKTIKEDYIQIQYTDTDSIRKNLSRFKKNSHKYIVLSNEQITYHLMHRE